MTQKKKMRQFTLELYTVFIAVSCIVWCSSMEIQLLFAQRDDDLDGLYGATDSLENKKTRSAIECHANCVSNKDCLSIFYNSERKNCILHRDSFSYATQTPPSTGWTFYLTKDGSTRCPSDNGFLYNRKLDLCFNLNKPRTINYPVIKQFCDDMNAELVRIDSVEKQQFIEFITANDTTKRICIQGTDKIFPPTWTFDDGTMMTYFNWDEAKSEPNGGKGNLEMFNGYKWHDLDDVVSKICLPICERRRL